MTHINGPSVEALTSCSVDGCTTSTQPRTTHQFKPNVPSHLSKKCFKFTHAGFAYNIQSSSSLSLTKRSLMCDMYLKAHPQTAYVYSSCLESRQAAMVCLDENVCCLTLLIISQCHLTEHRHTFATQQESVSWLILVLWDRGLRKDDDAGSTP